MSRQANVVEKKIFDIIRELDHKFYYEGVQRVEDNDQFRLRIEKPREEMVGHAYVTLQTGQKVDYEIRYNRIVNLEGGYTLVVPGIKAG